MTTLKVIPEEKPDINKVQTCSLLDKSAMSRNVFTKEECKRIIEIGKSWEQVDAQIQTKNPEAESEKNDENTNLSQKEEEEFDGQNTFLKLVKDITSKGFVRSNYKKNLVDLSDIKINLKGKK